MNISHSMSTLMTVEQYMSIYGSFVLTTLGIVGNILSILIFLSPRYRRQSSHFYLLSLALSDLCFLIINLLEDTLRNHNELYQSHINFLDRSSTLICILAQYIRNETRLLSSWIIVSFTIERLIVVFHPLKRVIICRRKISRAVVFVIFITTLLCNINVPFHYGITISSHDQVQNSTICDVLPKYRPIYMRFAIATMITVYLLPMCIIGFVNTLICCKLWRNSLIVNKSESFNTTINTGQNEFSSAQRSSHFSELLSCLHISRRSSTLSSSQSSSSSSSSSFGRKHRTLDHKPSINQYRTCRKLLANDKNPLQTNGYLDAEVNRPYHPSQSMSHITKRDSVLPKCSLTSVKTQIQSRTQRVTATLLLVSCSFLLLNTPYCAVWVANYVHGFSNNTLKSIKEITELFMLTNFCINFLLYCVSGKAFRSELMCLVRCQWKDLYDRNECDRMAQRKPRPRLEIRVNRMALKPKFISLRQNDQPQHLPESLKLSSQRQSKPKSVSS